MWPSRLIWQISHLLKKLVHKHMMCMFEACLPEVYGIVVVPRLLRNAQICQVHQILLLAQSQLLSGLACPQNLLNACCAGEPCSQLLPDAAERRLRHQWRGEQLAGWNVLPCQQQNLLSLLKA